MAVMEHNKAPISLREGHVFLDGVEVMDAVKCQILFTPTTWTGHQLGERGESTRWLGYAITGTMTERRSTAFLKDAIRKYIDSGVTPEFTIQGIMDDPGSDYYSENGADTVTALGVVLTGDITLMNLDATGDILEDEIAFNAADVA